MARIRNLKPDFFTDAELLELSPLHRLLFQGLWCHADREGRLEDRPKELKLRILPADACDVDAMLSDLERAGRILRYQVGGRRLISVKNFSKHQRCHKDEKPSELPPPPIDSGNLPARTDSPPTRAGNFPVKTPETETETETETEAGDGDGNPENGGAAPSAPSARVGGLRDGVGRLFREARGAEFDWTAGDERALGSLARHGEAEVLRRWEVGLSTRFPRCSSVRELARSWNAYAAPEQPPANGAGPPSRERAVGKPSEPAGECAVCGAVGMARPFWGFALCGAHFEQVNQGDNHSEAKASAWVFDQRRGAAAP